MYLWEEGEQTTNREDRHKNVVSLPQDTFQNVETTMVTNRQRITFNIHLDGWRGAENLVLEEGERMIMGGKNRG